MVFPGVIAVTLGAQIRVFPLMKNCISLGAFARITSNIPALTQGLLNTYCRAEEMRNGVLLPVQKAQSI
jgi:hypothetical protein